MKARNAPDAEICHGPRCRDYGGKALLAELEELNIDAKVGDCRSLCPYSPVAHVHGKFIPRATADDVLDEL